MNTKELAESTVLDINKWLDAIGCDRAYKKDMKETYQRTLPELQTQALATTEAVLDAVKGKIKGVENPNKPDPIREYDHTVTQAWADGFEAFHQTILKVIGE